MINQRNIKSRKIELKINPIDADSEEIEYITDYTTCTHMHARISLGQIISNDRQSKVTHLSESKFLGLILAGILLTVPLLSGLF